MTALPPRQPNRCGRCGAGWYDTHTCPNAPRSTSAPQIADIVRQVQADPMALRALRVEAAQQELRSARATIERLTELLNRALEEGRNVMPEATDDEAHAIETLAAKCLAILDA